CAQAGHPLPLAALGDGADGIDAGVPQLARALHQVRRRAGIVVHRAGVGHGADGGEAAGGGGARSGFDGLLVLEAGLAQMHVQINEPGRDDHPGAIEHARPVDGNLRTQILDAIALNHHVADAVQPDRGIGQSPVLEDEAHADATPSSSCKTAMRMSTPFSTCSRITDCGESATSALISTPRIIGPGCITSASGLAARSRSRVTEYRATYSASLGKKLSRMRSIWMRSTITTSAPVSASSRSQVSTTAPP